MKIILSRKGFDSSYGKRPGPILPGGRIISFPIPINRKTENESIQYSDLELGYNQYKKFSDLFPDLGISLDEKYCHLDPDLERSVFSRHSDWKPVFGQSEGQQTHLVNQGVTEGDLFVFFGWFRHTVYDGNKLRYDKHKSGFHMIFGYLQIGKALPINAQTKIDDWLKYHPHTTENARRNLNNTIYVSRDKLSFNDTLPGGGLFRYDEQLVLTKPGYSRSRWNLPECFQGAQISHHNESSWRNVYFQSVSRGQEFVVEANAPILGWARGLIERGMQPCDKTHDEG